MGARQVDGISYTVILRVCNLHGCVVSSRMTQGKEPQVRTLIQAFKTKELRNKILFVLGMIIIYRIGSFIPTPGVDVKVVQ